MAKKRKSKKTKSKKTKAKKAKMKKAKMNRKRTTRKNTPISQPNPDVGTSEPTVTYAPPIPTEVAATSIPESSPS
jgi:hypothetical protein